MMRIDQLERIDRELTAMLDTQFVSGEKKMLQHAVQEIRNLKHTLRVRYDLEIESKQSADKNIVHLRIA